MNPFFSNINKGEKTLTENTQNFRLDVKEKDVIIYFTEGSIYNLLNKKINKTLKTASFRDNSIASCYNSTIFLSF